jgi:exodeoxyribonuclease V beta subunit
MVPARRTPGFELFDLAECPLRGTNLIEASAGTGKTYAITGLFVRLILEKEIPPERILVVTYTNAATKELKDRIYMTLLKAVDVFTGRGQAEDSSERDFIPELKRKFSSEGVLPGKTELLKAALRNFDECTIATIHGFCQQMLIENAFESNSLYNTELISDETQLLAEMVQDYWRRHIYDAPIPVVSRILKDGIKKLVDLYGYKTSNPDLKVRPAHIELNLETLADLCNEATDVHARLRSSWQEDGDTARRLVMSESLNKGTYKAAKVRKALEEMAAFLESDAPPPDFVLPQHFTLFTAEQLARATKRHQAVPAHRFFDACSEYAVKATEIDSFVLRYITKLQRELFDEVEGNIGTLKRQENVQCFEDLLTRLRSAVMERDDDGTVREKRLSGTLRERFQAALIDEFQDTDPVQYAIFETVFGKESILFLIGDPKQAIYSFRGADVFAYMKAARNVENRHTLAYNYRSTENLVEAVNLLFGRKGRPFIYENIPFERQVARQKGSLVVEGDNAAPLKIWFVDETRFTETGKAVSKGAMAEIAPKAVAAEILRLLVLSREGKAYFTDGQGEKRALGPGDVAVLVRMGVEARRVQKELSAYGITSVLTGTVSVFESDEAEEIGRVLTATAFPGDERAVKAAITTAMLGISGNALDAVLNDEEQWNEWIIKFQQYHETYHKRGFIVMFRSLLVNERVKERIIAYSDGERRLTNILHIAELLHREELEKKHGLADLITWLTGRMRETPHSDEAYELRLESDEDAVKVLTIHKSKGLEFPIVFSPYNWHGSRIRPGEVSFHDEEEHLQLTLALDADESALAQAFSEELSENLRLFYVSLTRARYRCYTVWGRINEAGTSAPGYLIHGQQCPDEAGSLKENLENLFGELDGIAIKGRLRAIAAGKDGCIEIGDIPEGGFPGKHTSYQEAVDLQCAEFTGRIARAWRISSFSSLASRSARAADPADFDAEAPEPPHEEPDEILPGTFDIFTFPRGERAGTCLHEFLEQVDFQKTGHHETRVLAEKTLRRYGIDGRFTGAVLKMTDNLAKKRLGNGQAFSLADIATEKRVSEMEFYYPLRKLSRDSLAAVFGTPPVAAYARYRWMMERLEFSPIEGFVRGFIDSVFDHEGVFYLLDWKSNHLGYVTGNYEERRIQADMARNYYFFQYHLYAVALHKHLQVRVRDYDYDRHFGGVYYFFLRGLDEDPASATGIYFRKPGKNLIDSLSRELTGRG